MKIGNQVVAPMYTWTLVLLTGLVIISSYTLNIFPFALIFGIVLTVIIELAMIKFYLKRKLVIPVSGIITAIIIGSILPPNGSFLLVAMAVTVAAMSKFFIRIKSINVFNPAVIGILAAVVLFGRGDAWWVATNYKILGVIVPVTAMLVLCSYKARRLPTSFSFIAAFLLISIATGQVQQFTLVSIYALLVNVNYYFVFIMLSEPRTSPPKNSAQIVFGVFMAILYYGLVLAGINNMLLVLLLLGNIVYVFVYKTKYGVMLRSDIANNFVISGILRSIQGDKSGHNAKTGMPKYLILLNVMQLIVIVLIVAVTFNISSKISSNSSAISGVSVQSFNSSLTNKTTISASTTQRPTTTAQQTASTSTQRPTTITSTAPATTGNTTVQQTTIPTTASTTSTVSTTTAYTSTTSTSSATTTVGITAYTAAQVATHNSAASCWLIISGKVYDVTSYLPQHPGGEQAILAYCGQDATVAFNTKGGSGSHSQTAVKLLATFYIGNLA